jgi:hypothetical protein
MREVVANGYSVKLEQLHRELALVLYREGVNELHWSAEWGTDNELLIWIPRDVSFLTKLDDEEVRAMFAGDIVALKLPREVVPPKNLSEDAIREIKTRVFDAMSEMGVQCSFARQGWTSIGDANEITEA